MRTIEEAETFTGNLFDAFIDDDRNAQVDLMIEFISTSPADLMYVLNLLPVMIAVFLRQTNGIDHQDTETLAFIKTKTAAPSPGLDASRLVTAAFNRDEPQINALIRSIFPLDRDRLPDPAAVEGYAVEVAGNLVAMLRPLVQHAAKKAKS